MARPRYIVIQRNNPSSNSSPNHQTPNSNNRNRFEKWGNYNDIATLIVGIIVAITTLYLFNETRKTTKASIKSAKAAVRATRIADSTFKEQFRMDSIQRYNDSIADVRDSIKSYTDSVNRAKQFDLQNKATQAQIDALKEERVRFEKENTSYLAISSIDVQDDPAYNPPNIKITLVNMNHSIVKTDTTRLYTFLPDKPLPPIKQILNEVDKKRKMITAYYVSDKPNGGFILPAENATREKYKRFAEGNIELVVAVKIGYRDLVSDTNRIFEAVVSIVLENNKADVQVYYANNYFR